MSSNAAIKHFCKVFFFLRDVENEINVQAVFCN